MKARVGLVGACSAALAVTGCAGPKQALYRNPTFDAAAVSQVALLPIVDSRVDKGEAVDLEKGVREPIKSAIEKRGHSVQFAAGFGEVGTVADVDLQSPDAAWIRKLGTPEERYVMVVMLVDLRSKLTFGSTGNAELSGYLFDRAEGVMLWHDKGIGRAGQGGLLGMAFKGTMAGEALDKAVDDLASSFPEHRK